MKKKDKERNQLEAFKNVFPAFPAGTIVDGKDDGTEPDFFVVQDERRSLGIELTTLYRTPPPNKRPRQEGESIRDQIVEQARLIYESHGWPLLNVSVHFSLNQNWKKRDVPVLASRLARLVFRHPLEVDQHVRLKNPFTDPDYFPYQIEEIWISRYDWLARAHWSTSDADCIPTFSQEEIQPTIDKKNSRISSYRQNGSEAIWLLIVHGLKLSSMFEGTHQMLHKYHSEFDRVFLFNVFSQTYVELSLELPQNKGNNGRKRRSKRNRLVRILVLQNRYADRPFDVENEVRVTAKTRRRNNH